MDEPEVMLAIETADGYAFRRIRRATVLPPDRPKGAAAEDATRAAAAIWGLPDFVFRPLRLRRGTGSREVGDAILAVTDRAASVQVKSRAAPSGDDERERRWLDKKIAEAIRQAEGTIRTIRRPGRTPLVNERGRSLQLGAEKWAWVNVVVLDHPGVDDYVPSGDAVVLLRRDWEFLFEQLKSTSAVLEYLHRVGTEHVALGLEPVRYYEYAAADAAAPPSPPDPRMTALGYWTQSAPLLPQVPAGHGEDHFHFVIRMVLEDIAMTGSPTGSIDEQDRFDVLAAIDTLPVAYRAELGRDILSWIEDVASVPKESLKWRLRNIPYAGRPYLLFGAASRHSEEVGEMFRNYVSLRHQQQLDVTPERVDTMTVGVLLTPRADGARPWDTTMVATRGDQGHSPKARYALELLWGPLGTTNFGEPDWDEVARAHEEVRREREDEASVES
jgi:hypothetical protein